MSSKHAFTVKKETSYKESFVDQKSNRDSSNNDLIPNLTNSMQDKKNNPPANSAISTQSAEHEYEA